jgi:hypothetical protein
MSHAVARTRCGRSILLFNLLYLDSVFSDMGLWVFGETVLIRHYSVLP